MFETVNYIEAGLWIGIAAIFASFCLGGRRNRRAAGLAAITFALFGASDIVEVQTGAWWRPWWLFVWKAVCVLAMLYLLISWHRLRQR